MTYVPTEIDYEGSDADRLPDMGQKINANLNDIEAEFAAWMGAGVCGQFAHIATDFIGGTTGCLDNIDATDITDGEKAIVVVGTAPPRLYFYRLKSPDTTTESSPEVIQPDTGGASKRWMLAGISKKRVKTMASAPTAGDDVNDGWLVGDGWQYGDTIYFCIDNTVDDAEWLAIPTAGGVPSHHTSHEDGGSDEITKLKDDIQGEGAIDLKEITTPSAPASGRDKLYVKSGGGLYTLDSGSSETQLLDDSVLDTTTGHDHDGVDSKTVDHSNLANVTSDQHHAKSHTWEGGDHTGTLNEATVTFNTSTGHDHDGSDSKTVDHANLTNVTANQHHNQLHASAHVSGGGDELDGDEIDIDYTPTNYTASTSALDDHLAGIDTELGSAGGGADIPFVQLLGAC